MAPLLQELSNLEVEPLQIVRREEFNTPPGFDTVRSQESSLETLTAQKNVEVAAIWEGTLPTNDCCCCCCPGCCCC
jgi:hypothetical protein